MPFSGMYEDELKKRRSSEQVGGATINPKHFSYGAINKDIDQLRDLDMTAPDVNYNYNQGIHQNYGLEDMRDTINRLNTPQQMQYQSPEQMQQMMDTWLGAMQPYLDSQQQVAQGQYNQQVQALQNEWARRGLLGTTAAGMAEMDKAREFGLQSQNMQNAAMMDALAKSFDFANLGLAERDLGLRQDQAGMDAWMDALGMQEYMNQNIRDVNRAMAQDEFNNWADAMGLTLEQKQAVINSMLAGADLESTNQQRSFDNRMSNAMLGLQEQQSYLDNLYRGMGLRENQRQFNLQNALNWSKEFGQYVDPIMTGQGLRPQLQGKQTLGGTQQQADLTGMYQGQYTPEYRATLAQLMGVDPVTGDNTLQSALGWADHDLQKALGWAGIGLQRDQLSFNREQAARQAEQQGIDPYKEYGVYGPDIIQNLGTGLMSGTMTYDQAKQYVDSLGDLGQTLLTPKAKQEINSILKGYAPQEKPKRQIGKDIKNTTSKWFKPGSYTPPSYAPSFTGGGYDDIYKNTLDALQKATRR